MAQLFTLVLFWREFLWRASIIRGLSVIDPTLTWQIGQFVVVVLCGRQGRLCPFVT